MASPFRVFRKHQKVLIASLGFLAMIAFVGLTGPGRTLFSRAAGFDWDAVVVSTTEFGDLTERDLAGMMRRQQALRNFYARLEQVVAGEGGAYWKAGRRARIMKVTIEQGPEQAAVDTWLLAREAKRLGVVISDDTIKEFVNEVGDEKVGSDKLLPIVEGCGFSQVGLFAALREQLLADRLRGMFSISVRGAPPAQRWDYLNRMNRQVDAEVAGIDVGRFVGEVPDPPKKELDEFFEKYKRDLPNRDKPEPGFRVPQRVRVQYFMARIDELSSPEKVTQAEVIAEYRKNKEDWDKEMAKWSSYDIGGGTPTETPDEGKDENDKSADDKSADGGKDESKQPGDDGTADEDTADSDTGEETPKTPSDGDTSRAAGKSYFRLAAYMQDSAVEDSATEDGEAKDGGAKEGGDAVADPPEDTNGEPAAEPTDETTNDSGVKPDDGSDAASTGGPTDEAPDGPKIVPLEEPVVEQPEFRGELPDWLQMRIRRKITTEKVRKAFELLQEEMDRYGRERSKYRNRDKSDTSIKEPAKLDFEALAKKYGLIAGDTGMVSVAEMRQRPIGQSRLGGQQRFSEAAFGRNLLYLPEISEDMNDAYLSWITSAKDGRIPKLTDKGVREEVIRAWKMIKARKLAVEEAQKLAQKARGQQKSLTDAFAANLDIAVTPTGPFSWMKESSLVPGSMQRRPPVISLVNGVDRPGTRFMQTVADLGAGEIGVALNAPETVAYIVRVTTIQESDDQLWALFTAMGFDQYAAVGNEESDEAFQAWKKEIEKSAGLKWERKHDVRREEEEGEGEE